MELKGKTFLVIGLARTGRECVRFLAQRGAAVRVSDLRGADGSQAERSKASPASRSIIVWAAKSRPGLTAWIL